MPAFAAIVPIALLAAMQDSTARVDSDLTPYWSGAEGWRVFAYPDEENWPIHHGGPRRRRCPASRSGTADRRGLDSAGPRSHRKRHRRR